MRYWITAAVVAAALLPVGVLVGDEGAKPAGTKGGDMVLVPAGEFGMGCSRYDRHCDADERPYHRVELDAYYIDRTEVTNAEYKECVDAGNCRPAGKYTDFDAADQPAVGVSWDDAVAYCKWAGKRLPTEAEWEKAARGTEGRVYPWGNSWCGCDCAVQESGQVPGCGHDATMAVGSAKKGASPYGALDMAGNVWEWTADWYDPHYYKDSPDKDPKGPEKGDRKVRRGGGFANIRNYLRASDRTPAKPEVKSNSTGFRCALTAPGEEKGDENK